MRFLFTRDMLLGWGVLLAATLVARMLGASPWVTGTLGVGFVLWMFLRTVDLFRWSAEVPIRQRLIALGQIAGFLALAAVALNVLDAARQQALERGAQGAVIPLLFSLLGAVLVFLSGSAGVILASLAFYEAGMVRRTWVALAMAAVLAGSWALPLVGNNLWLLLLSILPWIGTPWREELTGRFKAVAFLVGFAVLVVVPMYLLPSRDGFVLASVIRNEIGLIPLGILRAAILLLAAEVLTFQVKTVFSPAARMASLRGGLRAKLLMFYVLAGAIPLLLVILILSIGFYIILGGYRASLGKRMVVESAEACGQWSARLAEDPGILDWARSVTLAPVVVAEDPQLSRVLAERIEEGAAGLESGYLLVQLEQGASRLVGLSPAVPRARREGYPCPAWAVDTSKAGLVAEPDGIWGRGVTARSLGDRRLSVEVGAPVDRRFLERMKKLTGVDFELNNGYWLEITMADRQVRGTSKPGAIQAPAEARTISTVSQLEGHQLSFLDRRLYFGGAFLPEADWAGREEGGGKVAGMLLVRTSLRNLYQVLFARENTINVLLLAIVGVLAALLLVIILAATGMGVRVAQNVAASVAALKWGTRRIRAGDLDYRIELTSRDEFEDLADSFNAMSAEIRRMLAAVKEKERLESELRIARSIQQRLLPQSPPEIPGYQVFGSSVSAKEVGGDYFDYLAFGPDSVGLAIADVSGKGITAALLMANLQASLRAFAREPSGIGAVLGKLNEHLLRTTSPEMYATFFYGILDAATGVFSFANAGHNPPLLVRADGRVNLLDAGGLPLGMLDGFPYEEAQVRLAEGDLLVLYTDGVTEAENAGGEHLGEERLREVVVSSRGEDARSVEERIQNAVEVFAAGHDQSDDLTVITVKVLGRGNI